MRHRAASVLTLASIVLAACTAPARRAPDHTVTVGDAASPSQPAPPFVEELQRDLRTESAPTESLPTGGELPGSLPGPDRRVNQDPTSRAQNETTIVASPIDPLNLVGAWNDWYAVPNTVIGYGWTRDGGETWQSGRLLPTTLPANQPTGDPALAVDGLGNVFLAILAYGGTDNGILVSKSTDGGETFGEPVRVDDQGDKPYIAADPVNQNVHLVWSNTGTGGFSSIFFAKSTDSGASFSSPVQISDGPQAGHGAVPAVGPAGEIYVVYTNFNESILFDRSLDGGSTWLDPDVVITNAVVRPRDPLKGGFRDPLLPTVAVDRSGGTFNGRIYALWHDQRFGDPDVLLAWSGDQGATWSAPVRVNDDAQGNDADQWFPWAAVDDEGRLYVSFLDRRDDPDGILFASYLATSTDGGQSFGPNVRVASGIYGPSDFGFLGDYTGLAISGGRLYPLWPDGRTGDEDIFVRPVELLDYDEDAVPNDGDLDGQYAGSRCTGGQAADCDDNCPGTPNLGQEDDDGDRVGNACDNCPDAPNVSQADADRDGLGDACDPCPADTVNDPDGDGLCAVADSDNCPEASNPLQEDADADGVGDACDPCPGTGVPNDDDDDGLCAGADNCPETFNPFQTDTDTDGIGDACDVCPTTSDAGQHDADGDGAGDACDCQSTDVGDRPPPDVSPLRVFKTGPETLRISWIDPAGADVHSVTRGTLSALGADQYGPCFAEGLDDTGFEDAELPAAGEGFLYLIQGQSFECGLGSLGRRSDEATRENTDPGACQGHPHSDIHPSGESTLFGSVTGGLPEVGASDDSFEIIREESAPGNVTRLEHRWTFEVAPASKLEFHVEGWQSPGADGDFMLFQYSTDGVNYINLLILGQSESDADEVRELPPDLNGTVTVRVVDTNRDPFFFPSADSVTIDEIWIRSVP